MYERVPSPAGRLFAGQYRAEIAARYCPALNEVQCKSINISAYERPTPSRSTSARTSGREDGNTRRPPLGHLSKEMISILSTWLHTVLMDLSYASSNFASVLLLILYSNSTGIRATTPSPADPV